MGVDRERAPEPRPRRGVAEAALDHRAVEDQQRVACPEPERARRVQPRRLAAAGPEQPPGERILGVDAGRGDVGGAGAGQRVGDVSAVVEVEDGGLELGADAVRREEPFDRPDERVLAPGRRLVARDAEHVAEHDHVGRDRQDGDHVTEARDCGSVSPLGRLDTGEARLGMDVVGSAP